MTYKHKEIELLILKKVPHLEKNCYIDCLSNHGEHISIFIKDGLISKRFNTLEPSNIIKAELFQKGDRSYLSKFNLKLARPELNNYRDYKKLFHTLIIINTLFKEKDCSPQIYQLSKKSLHNPILQTDHFISFFLTNLLFIEGFINLNNQESISQQEENQADIPNNNKLIYYLTHTPIERVHNIQIPLIQIQNLNTMLAKAIENNFNSTSTLKLLQE